jgi:hypothetical protein
VEAEQSEPSAIGTLMSQSFEQLVGIATAAMSHDELLFESPLVDVTIAEHRPLVDIGT